MLDIQEHIIGEEDRIFGYEKKPKAETICLVKNTQLNLIGDEGERGSG